MFAASFPAIFALRSFSDRDETIRENRLDDGRETRIARQEIRFSPGRSFHFAIANSAAPATPATGSGNSARRLLLLSHPASVSRPVPSRFVSSRIHNECARASQLYRVCGRAGRFPRTTLAPNPFQPFGSLFSDSKPADLQAPSTP